MAAEFDHQELAKPRKMQTALHMGSSHREWGGEHLHFISRPAVVLKFRSGERVFDFYLKETLIVQRLTHQVSLMRFWAALF